MRMETMFTRAVFLRTPALCFSLMLSAGLSVSSPAALAQAPAAAPAAPAAARQLGTVKAISGNSLTLTTDAGQQGAVGVADAARILQLAPGSTDLKSAQAITLADIAVGDRVLVTGKAGDDAGSLTASRVILMKSGDIAQKNEAEKADWQKRGSGGLVSVVDVGTGTLTVKDLATKRTMTVKVTANSDVRKLPAQAAAMFAARAKGGALAADANGGAQSPGAGQAGAGARRGPGDMGPGPGAGGPGGMGRSAGMDLSQMLARLPNETIGDLKVGDAVMIVASQTEPGTATVTAVTVLAGVEPILAATPSGAPAMTLSPWSVGGGGP